MAFEQFLGLGNGDPQYTHPKHTVNYDVLSPRQSDGELGILLDTIDEVMYPGEDTSICVGSSSGEGDTSVTVFDHEYTRGGRGDDYTWPLESVRLQIYHTRYLGSSALRQTYALQVESQVHQYGVMPNRITTKYFIEEIADKRSPYFGGILHPDVLTSGAIDEAQMTVYDCEQLASTLHEIMSLARYDIKDRRLAYKAVTQ